MLAILRGFFDKVMLADSAYYTDETGLHACRDIQKTIVFTTSSASTEDPVHKFGDPFYGTILSATFEMVGFHNAR